MIDRLAAGPPRIGSTPMAVSAPRAAGRVAACIRAVIVDLDGTLVDTLGDFDAALNETLKDLGRPTVQRADIENLDSSVDRSFPAGNAHEDTLF